MFQLPSDKPADRALGALAEALHAASQGHPLVLTYTFMQLAHQHQVLSPEVVQQVDPAPNGDARAYYKALWQRLPSSFRKDALHLIAEDSFIWPAGALDSAWVLWT